jgi:hypothetical protein
LLRVALDPGVASQYYKRSGMMLRSIGAVLLGVVIGGLQVAAVEWVGQIFFPPPPGVDPTDREALRAMAESIPVGAQIFVLLAWAVGSFGGGWIAARLAPGAPVVHALVVGMVLLLGGLANLIAIPSPLWFWILGLAIFLPAAYGGARVAGSGL